MASFFCNLFIYATVGLRLKSAADLDTLRILAADRTTWRRTVVEAAAHIYRHQYAKVYCSTVLRRSNVDIHLWLIDRYYNI